MIKTLKHLKPKELAMICISLGFIVLMVWLDLKMPEYMSAITRLIKEGGSMNAIWNNGGLMLACVLGSLAAAIIVGYISARVAASFSQRLRSLLFNKVDSFSAAEVSKFSTSSLVTRTTNDVTQVQLLVTMGLQLLAKAPIMAIWGIVKISGKGTEWTLATGIAVLVLIIMMAVILLLIMPRFKKMQTLTDNMNRATGESLSGLAVVRAYNAEKYQEQKFEKANKELTSVQLFANRAMGVLQAFMPLMISGMSLAIYWIGAALISKSGMPEQLALFTNMVVFMQYAMQIIMAFLMMTMMFIFLPRASVSAKRIEEVLDTESSIKDGTVTEGVTGMTGEVEFKNVSFKYPDAAEYVLHDVSFKANKGETIAFIGSTGSGKSTLINMVPRFYDATEGEILIDGVNVKDYKIEALNDKLGYVSQKAVLFSGTVSSNVAYGEKAGEIAGEDNIKKAVKIAQGKNFVEKMNDSYNAPIARGGQNVSGGQKQRLSIARAICKEPEILIFDDSFSALDYKTDRALRTALKKETEGTTSMIVAQRIGTIMDADKIVVLDEGKVVGMGTHKQLLKNCKVYKEIAYSQLSKEELA